MKKIIYLSIALAVSACQSNTEEPAQEPAVEAAAPTVAYFGDQITEEGTVDVASVPAQLAGVDSLRLKVVGTIEKVCQVKGCWMTMRVSDDQNMHVSFKDYGFFVPKDIDGKEVVIEGYAYIETMDVATLKHLAEDEGKSQAEIDAISEAEVSLSFVADGVIVKDYQVAEGASNEPAAEDHKH